jgi:hypothetical protein
VGDTLGLDADGRIGVIITKEVNKDGSLLGFVNAADLATTSHCPRSNEAEVFYGIAPDPDGLYDLGAKTKQEVADLMPRLIAHEVTHILQFTQYFFNTTTVSKESWESEGGASLAEQLVGNAFYGFESGQNLGITEFDNDYFGTERWYYSWASDLRKYFGVSGINAPEECTWLANDNDGPCLSGRAVYGVPGTLLRFILDYFGPSYSGGETAMMRDLTNSAQAGYDNLETVTGASFRFIQTMFGITLWADGRVWNTLSSWDLREILDGWSGDNYKLQPHTSSDAEPTSNRSVRGGSTAYLEWEPPSSHAPTSLRIRTQSGDELPDVIGMWILRIQ